MPRYAPQSLPTGGSRPPAQQDLNADDTEENLSQNYGQPAPAILLGQHIRRERGMQGVQRYVVSMRDHLTESEYEDLCHAMGVPTDLQLPQQHRAAPQQHAIPNVQENPYVAPQQQAPQQNNMQMMQMLMQLMGGMNGMGGSAGGGTGGMGGMNPMMLAQMLQNGGGMGGNMNGGSTTGGGMNGMNPLLLAQMLGSMQNR